MEWYAYCKSGMKPADIPVAPHSVYANDGWSGMSDWLGTGRVGPGQHRSFRKARAFVRTCKLKSIVQWRNYCKSGKKPADIPNAPQIVYANDGWAGYGDWLGTGRIADRLREYRPFKQARAFTHRLGLKSQTEWSDYCKSGTKPKDIPTTPQRTYANEGWAGTGDWLGNERKRTRL